MLPGKAIWTSVNGKRRGTSLRSPVLRKSCSSISSDRESRRKAGFSFFARCHFLCDSSHRNSLVPSMAGCRLSTGYLAVPISDLFARPSGPLNSQLPATMLPGPARGRFHSTGSLVVRGRAVFPLTTRDAKLADIRSTAARIGQPNQAGRPSARFRNICPLRPSMSRRQIFPSGSLPSKQSPGSAESASLF